MGLNRSSRLVCRILLFAVLALLAGCAAREGEQLNAAAAPVNGVLQSPAVAAAQQVLPGLGDLPAGLGSSVRSASAASYELLESAPVHSSAGASYSPGSLSLDPAQNQGLAWAVFELYDFPDDESVLPTAVNFEGSGSGYISLSNYSEQRWEHNAVTFPLEATLGSGVDFYSKDGSLYVAIIATNEDIELSSLSVDTSAALPNIGWDEREDNDSVAKAQTLPAFPLLGFEGSIGPEGYDGDTTDYYSFEAVEGQQIDLSLNYDELNANISLTLNKPGGGTLVKDDQGNSGERHLNIGLKAGTYTIKVSALSGGGAYTLGASFNEPAFTELEDNDSKDQANVLQDVLGSMGTVGPSSYDGDLKDYYTFAVDEGDIVTMSMNYPSGSGNFSLTLLGSNGAELYSDDQANPGLRSFSWGVHAGNAYAVVEAQNGSGQYSLEIEVESPGYDELENNDNFDTGTPLPALPQNSLLGSCGAFGYDGDSSDFYRFNCTDGDIVTVSLAYDEALANLSLTLYGPSGAVVHEDEDGNPGSRSFSWGLLGGSCAVAVKAQSGGAEYTLSISRIHPGYDETENNDNQINADLLPAFPFNNHLGSVGAGGYDGDVNDWFTFTVADQQLASFTLSYDETQGNIGFTLLDGAGDEVYEDSAGNTGLRSFDWGLKAGSYFIKVTCASGLSDYNLSASKVQQSYDELEDNDSRAGAQILETLPVTNFSGHAGAFGYDGDSNDYFFFNLLAPVSMSSTLDYNEVDGNLSFSLLDGDGSVVDSDTAGNPGTRSVSGNLAAGTYYLRVQCSSGSCDYSFDTT